MDNRLIVAPIDGSFSLRVRVYDVLKNAIVAMNIYDDGAELKLDERELSQRLNASRTPIREALTRLEQEGLVRIVPRKGVFILRKSVDEILEMIVVWAALECMAARLACMRAGDGDLASLRTLQASFTAGCIETHLDEYSDANIRFHRRILELSGCGLLLESADALFVHMRAIRARTMTEDGRANRSIIDHIDIIDAIEARNPDLAERLVRAHTMNLHAHVRKTWVSFDNPVAEKRKAS